MTFKHVRFPGFVLLGIVFVIPGLDGRGFSHQMEGLPQVDLVMQEAPAPSEWARRRINSVAQGIRGFMSSNVGTPGVPMGYVSVHSFREKNPVVEASEGMDEHTPMALASLTKPITAMGVLILVDQGKLRLDDPISRYMPEFRMERRDLGSPPITVRHLLQQTSGIPYAGRSASVPTGIEGFFMPRQMYPAGTHHEYSNSNYELLGLLIERVTGQSYDDYMRENLFGPAEMKNTKAGNAMAAASGLISTGADLSNFARMILAWGRMGEKQVVSAELIREMFLPPPHIPVAQNMTYYGMGWKINVARGRVTEAYHPGVWFKILTDLRIFPGKKTYFVILSNPPQYKSAAATNFLGYTTGNARRVISYMGPSEDLEARPTTPGAGILGQYSGLYANQDGAIVEIGVQGRGIVRKFNQTAMPLSPVSLHEFMGDGNPIPHEFVWRNGQVAGLSTPGGYYERRSPR